MPDRVSADLSATNVWRRRLRCRRIGPTSGDAGGRSDEDLFLHLVLFSKVIPDKYMVPLGEVECAKKQLDNSQRTKAHTNAILAPVGAKAPEQE